MMGGSQQTNVISSEAWVNVDVRLLPGDEPKVFLETMRLLVNHSDVTIEPENKQVWTPNSSPTDTDLYRTISGSCGTSFSNYTCRASCETADTPRTSATGPSGHLFLRLHAMTLPPKKRATRSTETMNASA